jgi:hypothetical protein
MEGSGRAEGMSELQWLTAWEGVRPLKARRDHDADPHDWEACEAPLYGFGGNRS